MNFFVNQAMGIGNSGVEHAQFYRANRFEQAKLPYRFVFMELVNNLHEAMDRWDLRDDQVINLWEFLAFGDEYARHGLKSRTTPASFMAVDKSNTNRMKETITSSGLRIREYYVKKPNPEKKGILLVSLDHVEIFNAVTGQLKVSYQIFSDIDHGPKIVNIHLYEQEDKKHLYFSNLVLLEKYFFSRLDKLFSGKNTFIIDRGEDNEVALIDDPSGDWNIIDMMHADHLSDRNVPSAPLWNNYYEYVLTHLDKIDRLVVATELQREDLLIDFPNAGDKIITIPVGGVSDSVATFKPKKLTEPLKLVAISRLAEEKHIDLIAKAVIKLHDEGIPVTLDIFGQGGARTKISQAITEGKAEEYIKLRGLTNHPDQEYPNYDAFVSASYSEGFGLTYIEAMNASLPVITFNARFGAQELVEDGVNGFALDFKRNDEEYNIQQLVLGIKKLLSVEDYQKMQQHVVESVANYRDQVIADKWRDLINGL